MKKIFLATMLILISITGKLCAQSALYKSEALRMQDETYATFNMSKIAIRHRHTAYLEKGNKLIVEMSTLKDYDALSDINAILQKLRTDMNFYKDSLEALGTDNIRIDYQTAIPESNVKFRFKKYHQDGDLYTEHKSDISKLKVTQDTIHIKINKAQEQVFSKKFNTYTPLYSSIQVTLLLNDYSDIDKLINDKETLQHIVDTMAMAATPKKEAGWWYETSVFYRPYLREGKKLAKYNYAGATEFENNLLTRSYHDELSPNLNIGASLLRNKIAPIANIGLEHHRYWKKNENNYRIIGLYTEPYFLFTQGSDSKFHTHVNWFINAEIGESHQENNNVGFISWSKTATMGLGYLINPDGIYQRGTTMKAFFNITLRSGITISPEVIATDNFKTIYPSLSVKILDIR